MNYYEVNREGVFCKQTGTQLDHELACKRMNVLQEMVHQMAANIGLETSQSVCEVKEYYQEVALELLQ